MSDELKPPNRHEGIVDALLEADSHPLGESDELKPRSTLSVHFDNREYGIHEVASVLTNTLITDGQYCDQTVIDLRDCVVALNARISDLEQQLAEVRHDLKCSQIEVSDITDELTAPKSRHVIDVEFHAKQLAEARKVNLRQQVESIIFHVDWVGERSSFNKYHRDYLITHLCFREFGVTVDYSEGESNSDDILKQLIEQGVEN